MSEIPSRETLGGWIDGVRGAGEEVGLPVNASAVNASAVNAPPRW